MSDVEVLFKRLQEHLGGSGDWHQLNFQYQQAFVQAVNNILRVFVRCNKVNNESLCTNFR